MFFTLSGFLITRLLIDDWQRDDQIRLGAFYERRFRRLMPSAVILLLAVAVMWTWFPGNGRRLGVWEWFSGLRILREHLPAGQRQGLRRPVRAGQPAAAPVELVARGAGVPGVPGPVDRAARRRPPPRQPPRRGRAVVDGRGPHHARRRRLRARAVLRVPRPVVGGAARARRPSAAASAARYYATEVRGAEFLVGAVLAIVVAAAAGAPRLMAWLRRPGWRAVGWLALAVEASLWWRVGYANGFTDWFLPWGVLVNSLMSGCSSCSPAQQRRPTLLDVATVHVGRRARVHDLPRPLAAVHPRRLVAPRPDLPRVACPAPTGSRCRHLGVRRQGRRRARGVVGAVLRRRGPRSPAADVEGSHALRVAGGARRLRRGRGPARPCSARFFRRPPLTLNNEAEQLQAQGALEASPISRSTHRSARRSIRRCPPGCCGRRLAELGAVTGFDAWEAEHGVDVDGQSAGVGLRHRREHRDRVPRGRPGRVTGVHRLARQPAGDRRTVPAQRGHRRRRCRRSLRSGVARGPTDWSTSASRRTAPGCSVRCAASPPRSAPAAPRSSGSPTRTSSPSTTPARPAPHRSPRPIRRAWIATTS